MKIFGLWREITDLIFRNSSNNEVTIDPDTAGTAGDVTFNLPIVGTGTDELVAKAATQTLTNKRLTTPKINEAVDLTATATELNQLDGVAVGGTAAGDIATIDGIQTLTNKSINSDNNTITNIVNADIKGTAAIALTKLAAVTASKALVSNGSGVIEPVAGVSATQIGYLSGLAGTLTTGHNLTFTTAAATTLTLPTGPDTVAVLAATQTFTNKTLTSPKLNENVALTSTSTDLNQLAGVSVGGAAAGSIVTVNATQTLTGKTIDADDNTLKDIVNDNIKATAAIARTKLGAGTAGYVVVNAAVTGAFSEEQYLDRTRGGTGITSTATFPASGTIARTSGESHDDVVALKLRDKTTVAHTLEIESDSLVPLTANRKLTINTRNASRQLDIGGRVSFYPDGGSTGFEFYALTGQGYMEFINARFNVRNNNATQRDISIISSKAGNTTLTLEENLTVGDGYDVTIVAEDAAGTITLDNSHLEVENTAGAGQTVKIINAKAAATATVTLNEDLTIGDGHNVTITAEDAAGAIVLDNATLEVEQAGATQRDLKLTIGTDANAALAISGTSGAIDQDVKTTASPSFANAIVAGELRMTETGGGADYTGFKAPAALGGNVIYTMPGADGAATNTLTTNGAGVLSWAAAASAALTDGHVDIGNSADTRTAVNTNLLGDIKASIGSNAVTFTNATNVVNWVAHTLRNGEKVYFTGAAATVPAELAVNTAYYVVNQATDTFQVALSPGGTALAFGDDGAGGATVVFGGLLETVGRKNYIMNGNFDRWQRGTSPFVLVNATSTYTADRSRHYNNSTVATPGVVTVSAETNAAMMPNSQASSVIKCLVSTAAVEVAGAVGAGDIYSISQFIEGQFAKELYGKTFTISFWARSTEVGNFYVAVGNNDSNRYYCSKFTIDTANTWEFKTIVIPHDTTGTWLKTSGVGLRVNIVLQNGSTRQGTADTWHAANVQSGADITNTWLYTLNNAFYISQLMVNEGPYAAPFQLFGGTFDTDLRACQRYYYRNTLNRNVNSGGGTRPCLLVHYTANDLYLNFNLPVTMRGRPFCNLIGVAGTDWDVRVGTANQAFTGSNSNRESDGFDCGQVVPTKTTHLLTNANVPFINLLTTSGGIEANAEL